MTYDAEAGGDWADYESGPFCRHWSDPADCDVVCARCGHPCRRHNFGDGEIDCFEDGCDCQSWVEPSGEAEAPAS